MRVRLKAVRIVCYFLLAVALAWTPVNAATASPLFALGYAVIPEPQKVKFKGGHFEFGSRWRLELGQGVKLDNVAVTSLKDGLKSRDGVKLETRGRGKTIELAIKPGSVEIGRATDKNRGALKEQAYKLDLASSGIRITANAPAGLFYGVETLVQLVKRAEGKLWLPGATITDWPDLEQRNIYWDDNHHLERMDVLKRALREAAFYKINGFVIKLNGHFEYKSAPAVVDPYALSPEQLQELTNYGLKYHVQLIPYLDGPAHLAFILKHSEYAKLREFPDSNYELCTTNPDSYKLLEGMYQDLMDANKGVKYFMLSTDEAYYVGLADNDQCYSAELAKKLGSVGKVEAQFLDKAAVNQFGVMSESVVLPAAGQLLSLGIDRDQAAAGEGTDIRLALFIQQQVPGNDAASAVAKDLREGVRPLGPIGRVSGASDVRPSFCPVGVFGRKGVVHPGHGVRRPRVAVPGDAICVPVDSGIAQFIHHASPQVVVVVENPYFSVQRGLFQRRAHVLLYKADFIFLPPDGGGHSPYLVRVHFVLDGDGLDLDPGGGVIAEEPDEILRVGPEVFTVHAAAQHRAVGLHPSGRTPRGREEEEIGIHLPGLAECGKNPFAVMVNAKPLQLRVRLGALVVAVQLG